MKTVYTIGHSNRSLQEFLNLLKTCGIDTVVDVRRFPGSRRVPWTLRENLEKTLPENGIKYVWLPELGGLRKGGYRKHMETEEYRRGLEKLLKIIDEGENITLMCKEKLWLKCHRRFIADSLVERSIKVVHIVEAGKLREHRAGQP